MIKIPKFTFGVGDRFAREGVAQLRAFQKLKAQGINVSPVWNKSNREHTTIGTKPPSVREEAAAAVKELDWKGAYFVDADHINMSNVNDYVSTADFFTLDVADYVGKPSPDIQAFVDRHAPKDGGTIKVELPGGLPAMEISRADIESAARKFLFAVQEAGRIYRTVEADKGAGNFVTEVSMDETDQPQTPSELYIILQMVADEKIPAQTIAPKFTGRFNKGVDYVGDIKKFEEEYNLDTAVCLVASKAFGLPDTLKISVHSGSDKFSIYPIIRRACAKFNAGVHVKTAGTTWVEEFAALAAAGPDGLEFCKEIYVSTYEHIEELSAPYAAVIDIDRSKLPTPDEVSKWDGAKFAETLMHETSNRHYNMNARQLVHIGYKYAAKAGERYYGLLEKYKEPIGEAVTYNIYNRHMSLLFLGDK